MDLALVDLERVFLSQYRNTMVLVALHYRCVKFFSSSMVSFCMRPHIEANLLSYRILYHKNCRSSLLALLYMSSRVPF